MNMNINKQIKFILAISLQIFIFFTLILFKNSMINTGTEFVFKVEQAYTIHPPIGNYVNLKYNISDINLGLFGNEKIKSGDIIYVLLQKQKNYWTIKKAQKSIPENQSFIKGQVSYVESEKYIQTPKKSDNRKVYMNYGIEQYYISKKRALELSNNPIKETTKNKPLASIVITKNGNAMIKQIYIDNKPWL